MGLRSIYQLFPTRNQLGTNGDIYLDFICFKLSLFLVECAQNPPEGVFLLGSHHQSCLFVHGVAVYAQIQPFFQFWLDYVETETLMGEQPLLSEGVGRSVLDDGGSSLSFVSLDGQAHLAPDADDHVAIFILPGLSQLPTLVTSAVEFVLDNWSSWLKGGSWEIEVETGVSELYEWAVEYLVFAGYLFKLPPALTGFGVGLATLESGLELKILLGLLALPDPVFERIVFGIAFLLIGEAVTFSTVKIANRGAAPAVRRRF